MNLTAKLAALDRIYGIYRDFVGTLEIACNKGCATCCTSQVTLTTLEGYRIVDFLTRKDRFQQLHRIDRIEAGRRFCPQLTTNALAEWCARRQDPPEEPDRRQGLCPLLADAICPIYPARPFGCRCLVSRHVCARQGYADIDEFVLTVNTVFLQVIEHLDASGATGNLVDILRFLESEDTRRDYRNGRMCLTAGGLVPNRPLKILMVPPEHQKKIKPLLQLLSKI